MKQVAGILLLGLTLCGSTTGGQMKVADLYQLCTSSNEGDKIACQFYILGAFEGLQMGTGTVRDKSGVFQEVREKPFCVPEGLSSSAMELIVKMKMGADLAVFPEDRSLPAVSFLIGLVTTEFPCRKVQ